MAEGNRESSEQFSVVLPCQPDDFSDFIAGLLGKSQKITKRIHGPFELTKDDIENFYHLVLQRVTQQNEATLIQFTVNTVYDDESTVLLNSFDDFRNYHEVRPLVSIEAHLSWTFLVRFQDRRIPERQQIDVSIDSKEGYFKIAIHHTARTWGADIEALLTGHILNLIKIVAPTKKYVNSHSGKIGFSVGAILFLCSLFSCFYITQSFLKVRLDKARSLQTASSSDPGLINAKIDYLIDLAATGTWPRFFFYILFFIFVSFIISIFFGFWAGMEADNDEPSFLLLTKQAERYKEVEDSKNKKTWRSFVLSLAMSILTGVVGNILFALLLLRWRAQ